MITQERVDEIDGKLTGLCAAGYAYGVIGEANIRVVLEEYPELTSRQRVYRLGDVATLTHGMAEDYDDAMVARLEQLEELLDGGADYPVLDEGMYQQVLDEFEVEWVRLFAEEHKVSEELIWKALSDLEVYFEESNEWLYPSVDEDEIIARARVLGNTWAAHYGMSEDAIYHWPESCWYCVRAEEVA